jgi:guanylate kinase
MSLAPLIVVSGPSGVGKTCVVDAVLARTKLPLRRAITATTRGRRPGEENGVHYHFWDRARFEQAIANKEMLEYAEVHGRDFYGTPSGEVDPYRKRGVGVVLVIDVQGAGQVRAAYPNDNVSVFVYPPTFADLEARLRGRGEPEESIRRRLQTATLELARMGEFDHRLMNDDLAATATALAGLIQSEFQKRGFEACSTN